LASALLDKTKQTAVRQQRAILGENRLLRRLAAGDFAQLEPQLKKTKMNRGDVLHPAGQPIRHVYFPISGMVSMLAILRTGQAIEIAVIGREGTVGGSIVAEGSRSFAQATVHITGEAWSVRAAPFLQVFESSKDFRTRINRYQSLLALQTQQSVACHAFHRLEARLARWLLHVRDTVDRDAIDLTQGVFAQMLGVQRSSVSLTAKALQKAGLIRYSRGKIMILDRKGIEECACECYEVVKGEIDKVTPQRK
jgi:CRP-like cAMP-binding protein